MDATNAQTCRTCLAENAANLGLNCIMQNCPSSRTYKEILQELTQIQIMDELEFQMPQNICSSCYKQLQIAYNFIRKSQECNQKLLEMFSKHVQADDGMEKVEYVIVKQEDDEQFLMDMVQDIRNEPVQMSIVKEEKILENEQMEEASCSNINKVVEDYDENSKSLTENSSHMFSDNPCDDDDDEYIPDKDDEEYIPDKEFTKPNELDKSSMQIIADQKSLTEDIDLLHIFKSWELCDELCHILFTFGITSTTILKKMEIEDVEYLFNKLDQKYTAELIKFKAGFREWRRNINLPFICERDTLSANSRILELLEKISDRLSSSQSTDCPLGTQISAENSICGTSLINLLKSTVKGQLVLTFSERNKYIDSKNQKTLVHCIVEKYIANKAKLTYAEMQQWSYAICEVFTKEKPETYFLKRKDGKKNPTGKLFSRWTNIEKEKFDNDPATADESLQDLHCDKYFEQKCWLQHNCSPMDQVLSFWRETRKTRIQEIHNSSSLNDIFREWPRYNDFLGYELVEIDFDFLYPDKANNLFLKLETFYEKLFNIFDHEIKDRASREYYIQYLRNENISKDSKYCVCTILIHALLQPQRLNKKHKPSIADAQTDFVTLVPTINDLQPKILEIVRMYAERKETLQPRIMVIGPDFSKISEFFVFCDGLKWKCASYMKLKITTPKQFQKLLELLQENPSLINTFNTKIDKENSRKKWKKITNELNSLGPPIRDEKGWQKVWADYKCHIKKKMVRGHVFTPLQAAVSHLLRSNHPANACNVQNKKADDVSKKSKVNDIAAPAATAATAPPPPDNTTTINKENMEPKSQVFAKKRNNMTAFDKHELLAEQLQVQTDLYKEVRHFLIAIEKWNQKSFQLNEEKLKLYKQDLIKKQENRAALLELRKEEIELKKKILELKEYKHIIDENM